MGICAEERVKVGAGEEGVDDGADAVGAETGKFAEAVEGGFDAGAVVEVEGVLEDGEDGVFQGFLVRSGLQVGEDADVPEHVADAVEFGGVGFVEVAEGFGAAAGEAVAVEVIDGMNGCDFGGGGELAVAQGKHVVGPGG